MQPGAGSFAFVLEIAAVAVAVAGVAACSGEKLPPRVETDSDAEARPPAIGGGGPNGGADGGGDTGTSPDGGACNDLSLDGVATVDQVARDEDPPAPSGGTVFDGDYVLTAATYYTGIGGTTGATGETDRARLHVQTGTWLLALDGPTPERSVSTVTTTGTTLSRAITCPVGGPSTTDGYIGSSTTLVVYAGPKTLTFTKQ